MIETHEDWEHVKTVAELQSGPSLQHAVDTIEALREVARAAKSAIDAGDKRDKDYVGRIIIALDALSDWLTE